MKNILFSIFLGLASFSVFAEPIAVAVGPDGEKVTIYTEDCRLKDVVSLPQRATWEEKNKKFEGCAGGAGPFILFYFKEDKSVTMLPQQVFVPLKNI